MVNAEIILKRQGYKSISGACELPATIWQSPHGRRVLLEDGRIYTKADIERRAIEAGYLPGSYYFAVVHNWE